MTPGRGFQLTQTFALLLSQPACFEKTSCRVGKIHEARNHWRTPATSQPATEALGSTTFEELNPATHVWVWKQWDPSPLEIWGDSGADNTLDAGHKRPGSRRPGHIDPRDPPQLLDEVYLVVSANLWQSIQQITHRVKKAWWPWDPLAARECHWEGKSTRDHKIARSGFKC